MNILKFRGSRVNRKSPIWSVRKSVIGRRESKFENMKKATSRMYKSVLFPLQHRNLFKRIAPRAKKTPGIDDTRRTNPPAINRSGLAGVIAINGMNREKKIEEKKRKIKYGLYG
jgi:hypothetical protein